MTNYILNDNSFFDQKMYFSSRAFIAPISSTHWVLFSPDHIGAPIVITNYVYYLLKSFEYGGFVDDIFRSAFVMGGYTHEQIFYCINALINRGFLVKEMQNKRYSAHDSTPINNIGTIEVWLHITNYCNLQCSYCFVNKSKEFMDQGTIDKTISRLVDTAKNNKIKLIKLKFAGGEATLAIKKVMYFHNKLKDELLKIGTELKSVILSNGTILNSELIDFILQEKIDIGISLDGYGSESHDIYRVYNNKKRNGSWDVIMQNIEKLLNQGVKPGIMATISEESCTTLTDLVSWINQNDLISRLSVVREPSALRLSSEPVDITVAYSEMCEIMKNAFEKAFCELQKPIYSPTLLKKMSICELHFYEPTYNTCCGIGANHIVIREDGNLVNCPMTLQEQSVVPLVDLLQDIRKTFQKSPLERNESKEKNCLDCQWFPVCVGGCPVNNSRNAGDPFAISPMHNFYQYVIPRYIIFYGEKVLQHFKKMNISDYMMLSYD